MNPHDPAPPAAANGTPAPGLPPVTPPSGRFIAQLFLVPGMIVMVAVLFIFFVSTMANSGRTPAYFLAKLDSDNVDIRWRGASDLAQVLQKSKDLKADAAFALDLAERLQKALDELSQLEKTMSEKIAPLPVVDQDKAWRKLAPHRDYVDFLVSDLGHFYAPVGAPLLCAIINREESPDVKGHTMMRRKAVWALSNLGNQVKRFDQELAVPQRETMIETLKEQMAGANPQRAAWAMTALHYVDPRAVPAQTPGVVQVVQALARCAQTQDRNVREHVAMALNFWDGDLVEDTLLRLARDDGFGTLIRVSEND